MAEYYPLLAKAVGSLPNSTPDVRRAVYERARKALIGQLRTLHPPVPDEDIERESVELDRAVERLEAELAAAPAAALGAAGDPTKTKPAPVLPARGTVSSSGGSLAPPSKTPAPKTPAPKTLAPNTLAPTSPALKTAPVRTSPPAAPPMPALRTKLPAARPLDTPAQSAAPPRSPPPAAGSSVVTGDAPPPPSAPPIPAPANPTSSSEKMSAPAAEAAASQASPSIPVDQATDPRRPRMAGGEPRARSEGQRPIAPQPPAAKGPRRRLWIIPATIVGVIVVAVGVTAYKLRDRPERVAAAKPAAQTQADSGKIAERVGGTADTASNDAAAKPSTAAPSDVAAPAGQGATTPADAPAQQQETAAAPDTQAQQTAPAVANPELPVAHRAALLIEAPDQPNKVKTFLGNVVWKLNNVSTGPSDAVGLAVEADVDLPDDKTKAIVTFEKNTDSSLPASHTIKVRFIVLPGSPTGDIKQISVPQMRREDSPSGEPLAGVTVPVVPNSFLVGLSPGNAESANIELLKTQQWIDIPMLLDSGKIAKLTFEKSDSGQRDLAEAIAAWQKS